MASFHFQGITDTRTDSNIVVLVTNGLKLKRLSVNVAGIDYEVVREVELID